MPKIAVIGDAMLDTYHDIVALRSAPEGGLIYRSTTIENRPGAAANIAICLQTLGWDVTLYAHCGKDPASSILRAWAHDCAMSTEWFDLGCHPLRNNTRYYLPDNHCHLRLDGIQPPAHWENFSMQSLQSYDAVVLYDKGSLHCLAEPLLAYCAQHGIKTYIDPCRGANRYAYGYMLKANREELCSLNPQNMATTALKRTQAWTHCLITHDTSPLEYWDAQDHMHSYPITPAPQTIDPIGAGDAFFAACITAEAEGASINTALYTAMRAGALAVGKRGTYAPTRYELGFS